MKPKIGIILRKSKSESGKQIGIVYTDIINAIIKSNGIPLTIPNDNIDMYLDICQGFILQGGDLIDENNLKLLNTLKEKNIPTLAICLGMQEMSLKDNGELIDIPNHNGNILHEIIIDKSSTLYTIIGTNKTIVNSRHNSCVKRTKLKIGSVSYDNIIESVEDPNHKFYLGLEWHPENMYNTDINSRKIFDYFIKICND